METNQKPSNTDTAVKAVGYVFGALHFTFQSLADLTAHAEGHIVEKITKGEITKSSCIEHRRKSTDLKQANILLKVQEFKAKQQSKTQTSCI